MAAKKLGCDGAKHDQKETKEHSNIEHDRQRVQNSGHESTHSWHGIDCSQRSKNSHYSNSTNILRFKKRTNPTKNNDNKVQLKEKLMLEEG